MSEKSIRVLLVDDDVGDYDITRILLRKIEVPQYDLEWVADFDTACLALTGEFDVCLMDYRLGTHNGLDLLRHVISEGCQTPIILLTGLDDRDVDLEAMRAGAVDYLTKGHMNGPLLDRAIRYAMQRKQAQDALQQAHDELELRVKQRTAELELTNERLQAEVLERKRTEIALRNSNHELAEANEAKNNFLANMSHELRTPLNAVIGMSEVLIDKIYGDLNEHQADYMRDIHDSGNHLLLLINDVLDLAKIEAGRDDLDLAPVDLITLVEDGLRMVRERAKNQNIELLQKTDIIPEVMADERKIKQAIFNLMSNAVKFTPEGGQVGIEAAVNGDVVEFCVWDTGIGIAFEDQERIFEAFQQADAMLTKRYEGTGLGLALVKQFVELHGGTLWVKSELDEGARFYFTLPFAGPSV